MVSFFQCQASIFDWTDDNLAANSEWESDWFCIIKESIPASIVCQNAYGSKPVKSTGIEHVLISLEVFHLKLMIIFQSEMTYTITITCMPWRHCIQESSFLQVIYCHLLLQINQFSIIMHLQFIPNGLTECYATICHFSLLNVLTWWFKSPWYHSSPKAHLKSSDLFGQKVYILRLYFCIINRVWDCKSFVQEAKAWNCVSLHPDRVFQHLKTGTLLSDKPWPNAGQIMIKGKRSSTAIVKAAVDK